MRVVFLALSALALSLPLFCAGIPIPHTDPAPAPGPAINAVDQCMLQSFTLTAGAGPLTFTPNFQSNVYFYDLALPFSVSFLALHIQTQISTSVATIALNGNLVGSGAGSYSPPPFSVPVGTSTLTIDVLCLGECNYRYTIIICRARDTGVVGDPQFTGLKGQSFQVHGVSGEVYNIVSDPMLQYNSRFVFLDQGECPIVNGKKQKGCWSHPGSYLGELGIKTKAGDLIHVVTGPAKQGFAEITVNGKAVDMGETIMLGEDVGSVTRNSTHSMTLRVDRWTFDFENSDMFLNQRVEVRDMKTLRSHGLLGQTWREKVYPNAIRHIQGEVDDYVIRSGDIYGDDFVFNQYN